MKIKITVILFISLYFFTFNVHAQDKLLHVDGLLKEMYMDDNFFRIVQKDVQDYLDITGRGIIFKNQSPFVKHILYEEAELYWEVCDNLFAKGFVAGGGGSFIIDHPQARQNQQLRHSFIGAPDMMNVYNGNITTNAKGTAIVQLPAYFQALNTDFRYQLTVIGDFAQAIIAEEIKDNQFKIKTDQPNIKVSWQVTGIRNDTYAKDNRLQVEVEKQPSEKGKLLYTPKEAQVTKEVKKERIAAPEEHDNAAISIDIIPNPTNTNTAIHYTIPVDGEVRVVLFNQKGETLEVLKAAQQRKGKHQLNFDTFAFPNGNYFVRILTSDKVATKQLVIMH